MTVKTYPLKDFPVCVLRGVRTDMEHHRHKYYELVYVYEGMVDHVLNGEHHILTEGNYFLLSPDDVHTYVSINKEPFRIINFMFHPALIDSSFTLETPFKEIIKHPSIGVSRKKLLKSPLGVQFFDDDRRLRPMFLNAFSEYKQKKIGYVNALRATAEIFILACLRNVCVEQESEQQNVVINKIIEYVNENYLEDISLSSMCDSMGYNVQYISRVFKTQVGMNFSTFLINKRIQKACSLLLSSDMTIQQIANEVGYSNMGFFYNSFKKIMGETPAEFRNK